MFKPQQAHLVKQQNMEARTGDQDDQNRAFDFNAVETKTDDPNTMLKGMTGYQLTLNDLEFIKEMKEEKLIKKLQRDLEEVQRLLKKEMMAAELACASRDKAKAELRKFPSCEQLAEWVEVVLQMTSPLAELTGRDTESLLAMVTKESIQRAIDEKRIELARMEKMVTNKKKREAKEREQLEKQIASGQLKVQGLMSQLADLKSELAQHEEAHKALEVQSNAQEAPEIKVEAEELDASEELQANKSQAKRRGKERKKAAKSTEKLQDTTNQSKSTRGKRTEHKTDHPSGVKDNHASKNTSETLKAKQKSGAAAEKPTVKAARGPQKKAEEKESNPRESEQAVRGRRKPRGAAQTAASQPKNQSKVKTGEAQSTSQQAAPSRGRQKAAVAADDAGEEAQNAGLRRSKRIASKR